MIVALISFLQNILSALLAWVPRLESCYNTPMENRVSHQYDAPLPPPPMPLPDPNPVTRAAHRREVFWQISVPLIVGSTILFAFAFLALWGTFVRADTVNRWGWVSLVWLIVPALFFLLVLIILSGGLVYLVVRLIAALPAYARMVQDFFAQVAIMARRISDKAVEPVLKIQTFNAKLRAIRRR